MAKPQQNLPVTDPSNVPEALCDGQINVAFSDDDRATITFTHVRPEAGPLFGKGIVKLTSSALGLFCPCRI
jgi:hypothetical protein